LQQRVAALPWFHEIDLGHGVVTPGSTSLEVLQAAADVYFADDLVVGKTVIDVGCWDGFNSFEAKRRGAARVLATDHFVWADGSWGSRDAFELAREALGLDVAVLDIDLAEITPDSVGVFDVVLFAGVLYHMRHPLLALEQLSRICSDTLIVESHLDAVAFERPAMVFYPRDELGGDLTNWWGPNPACIVAMLNDVGFPRVESVAHPHPALAESRGIFRARGDS
jgi:tRNA (mo5U34)-methyltransferase